MTKLDFPDTPSTGQLFGSTGTVWRFDGTRWASTAGASGARGRVAYAQVTTTQAIGATTTPLTGVSVSWTADPSRTYRTTLVASVYSTVATDYMKLNIMANAGTEVQDTGFVPGTVNGVGVSCEVVESGLSGVQTRYGAARRAQGSGSVVLYAAPTNPTFIMVEDITFEAGVQGVGGGGIVFNQSAIVSTTPTRIEARSTTATPVGSDVGVNFAIPFTSPPTVIAICGDGWPFTVIATRVITTTGFICDIIDERSGAKKLDNTGIRYIAIGPS